MTQTVMTNHAFVDAQARWKNARVALRTAEQNIVTLQAAMTFEGLSREERQSDRMADLREKLAAIFPEGLPSRRKIEARLHEEHDVLEKCRSDYQLIRDEYEIERRNEALRVAQALQPEHMQALREIAVALEIVSELASKELRIRERFAATSPEQSSCLLPETDLRFVRLDRWDSPASRWARSIEKWIS